MSIRTLLLYSLMGVPGLLPAEPFNRLSTFKSPDEFMAALRSFTPQQQQSIYSRAFAIEDFGEGGKDALIVPAKIEEAKELWSDGNHALVFATAHPQTEASNSEVAVLIVLSRNDSVWKLGTLRRYEAIGKYAQIECAVTSNGYKPTERGHDSSPVTLTFKRDSGGRGASDSTSWSLAFAAGKLYELK